MRQIELATVNSEKLFQFLETISEEHRCYTWTEGKLDLVESLKSTINNYEFHNKILKQKNRGLAKIAKIIERLNICQEP